MEMARSILSEVLSSDWQEFITFVCCPALGAPLPRFRRKVTLVPAGNPPLVLPFSFVHKKRKERLHSPGPVKPS